MIGYKFPNLSDLSYGFEGVHDSLLIKIAKNEGSYIHPASKCKEWEKELRKKENDPIEKCKKQLDYLIYGQHYKLYDLEISRKTIDAAMSKVNNFISRKGPQTNKKLSCLFPAALLTISEKNFTYLDCIGG